MTIEIFGKLNSMGDSEGDEHILTGSKQDFNNLANWLEAAFELNKRKKSVSQLALKFRDQTATPMQFIYLNKKDAITLHEALISLSDSKRSAPLKRILNKFEGALCVY